MKCFRPQLTWLLFLASDFDSMSSFQVDLVAKIYDVNLVYSGSYDSISPHEMRRDPEKKRNLDFVKFVSDCLSADFGRDRVYYPQRDMLGGANLFDEFSDVINGSSVTLLIISKDIGENAWYKWLNQMAYKNEKDKFGLKTVCLAVPGVQRSDIIDCKCEFMLVENIVYAEVQPSSKDEVRQSRCKYAPSVMFGYFFDR